jgi:hypothetical protein
VWLPHCYRQKMTTVQCFQVPDIRLTLPLVPPMISRNRSCHAPVHWGTTWRWLEGAVWRGKMDLPTASCSRRSGRSDDLASACLHAHQGDRQPKAPADGRWARPEVRPPVCPSAAGRFTEHAETQPNSARAGVARLRPTFNPSQTEVSEDCCNQTNRAFLRPPDGFVAASRDRGNAADWATVIRVKGPR